MNFVTKWGRRKLRHAVVHNGFETAARTHEGARDVNEDRLLNAGENGLFAVADGMGGHKRGDIAASTVIDALHAAQEGDLADIEAAIDRANATIQVTSNSGSVSGSTVVILRVSSDSFDCLWAGDSELWLARSGKLRKLTRDHSVVEELIQSGLIEEEDRRSHPHAHLVTRAIGASESVKLDRANGRIERGDLFLLCSDGLTNAISEEDLGIVFDDDPLEMIADKLLACALDRRANDNVSFILVKAI